MSSRQSHRKFRGELFAKIFSMRHTLYNQDPKFVRDSLNKAVEKADKIHDFERDLIILLKEIDQNRFYVRYGYNSLRGFCNFALKFSRTQSQRIVTEVRRS